MKFKNMNLPNKLTTIRMICVPIVILLFALFMLSKFNICLCDLVMRFGKNDLNRLSLTQILITIIFIFASITDFLDGYISRKKKLVSDYGKLMDPLADKLLVNTTLIGTMAALMYDTEWYSVIVMTLVIISIARDVAVDALRMYALKKDIVVPASIWGKLKTATLMPGIVGILIGSVWNLFLYLGLILVTIGCIFSIIGGILYAINIINDKGMAKLVNILKEKNLTISSCESLTGGKFASSIVNVPGASNVYKGSYVTYMDDAKQILVDGKEILDTDGAISENMAIAMARKVKEKLNTNIAISFTGNAGPSASEGKEVGLVYSCIIINDKEFMYKDIFKGDRETIRNSCINIAEKRILELLEK